MKKQLQSFRHAFEGIFSAICTEAHIRFHIVAAVYVFLFAYLGEFTETQWTVLILTVAVVITAELINTAIERLCDIYTTEENKNIKFIKDVSAGAVLVCAIGAAIIALFLFISTGKLMDGIELLLSRPLWLFPFGISVVLAVLFVIRGDRLNTKNK